MSTATTSTRHIVTESPIGPLTLVRDDDDAWSETFLAAMTAYPGLPADANVEAWLVTIAHRKAVDIIRAAARRPLAVGDTPDGQSPDAADGRDLDLAAAVAAARRAAADGIARLRRTYPVGEGDVDDIPHPRSSA